MTPGSHPSELDHNNGQVVYCQDASKHVVLISTSWLNTVCLQQRGMGLLWACFGTSKSNQVLIKAPLSREEQHHKMFWFSGIHNWWSLSHWVLATGLVTTLSPSSVTDVRCQGNLSDDSGVMRSRGIITCHTLPGLTSLRLCHGGVIGTFLYSRYLHSEDFLNNKSIQHTIQCSYFEFHAVLIL